jgi:hypothetical protein
VRAHNFETVDLIGAARRDSEMAAGRVFPAGWTGRRLFLRSYGRLNAGGNRRLSNRPAWVCLCFCREQLPRCPAGCLPAGTGFLARLRPTQEGTH